MSARPIFKSVEVFPNQPLQFLPGLPFLGSPSSQADEDLKEKRLLLKRCLVVPRPKDGVPKGPVAAGPMFQL